MYTITLIVTAIETGESAGARFERDTEEAARRDYEMYKAAGKQTLHEGQHSLNSLMLHDPEGELLEEWSSQ